MKVSEKAYIAGMLDADGSVSIVNDGDKRLFLRVSVKQNSKGLHVLEWMKAVSGLGNISKSHTPSGYQPVHQWQITDVQAKKLLMKVLPFLQLKRLQARTGIAFATMKAISHAAGSRGSFHREALGYYEECRTLVMKLNEPAPPTETERENFGRQVGSICSVLRSMKPFKDATVRSTRIANS